MAEAKEAAATDTSDVIEVLSCNWTAVEVYQACQMTRIVGMTRVVCTGIAAVEIHAALLICGVKPRQWQAVSEGVRLMGLAAAERINAASGR